jgi:hypothetical protein
VDRLPDRLWIPVAPLRHGRRELRADSRSRSRVVRCDVRRRRVNVADPSRRDKCIGVRNRGVGCDRRRGLSRNRCCRHGQLFGDAKCKAELADFSSDGRRRSGQGKPHLFEVELANPHNYRHGWDTGRERKRAKRTNPHQHAVCWELSLQGKRFGQSGLRVFARRQLRGSVNTRGPISGPLDR